MSKVIMMVSFELNDQNLLKDWKEMSDMINTDMKGADGFISRDSGKGEDGKIYCIVKWDSKAQQETFRAELESRAEWPKMMEEFGRIVNLDTMKSEVIEVL